MPPDAQLFTSFFHQIQYFKMDTTRLLIGTAVGVAANFLGGWLIYGFLLAAFMSTNYVAGVEKTDPDVLGIFGSTLVFAFFLTFVFERWAGIRTLQTGAIAGAIIGGLTTLSFDLSLFAMANHFASLTGVITDVLANTALSALTGAAIGWYLGYKR
jgi:hypothetical protein